MAPKCCIARWKHYTRLDGHFHTAGTNIVWLVQRVQIKTKVVQFKIAQKNVILLTHSNGARDIVGSLKYNLLCKLFRQAC